MRRFKFIGVLISLLLWASVGHGQGIPVQGSTVTGLQGHYGQLGAGLNGLQIAVWDPQGFTQGTFFGFNNLGGSNGESDFINYHPGLTGGYNWFSPTSSALGSSIMSLSSAGVLTLGSVHSNFVGPLSGNVSGSIVGPIGAFGDLVATYSGSAPGAWTPVNGYTSGSWLSLGQKGGSNQETDFINQYVSGNTGGFAWWAPTGSSLTSALMSLDTSGNLTVAHLAGNASTASALAANPADCTANRSPTGVDASGVAQNCGPQTLYGNTGSVCTTPTGAGSTCTSNITWANGTFSSGGYYATCTGVNPSGTTAPIISITAKGTTTITVQLRSGTASQADAATYSEIDCIGMLP